MRFRAYTRSSATDARRAWRLNYCGTCKTLGRLYGARTRFLLNHDTVFLAELLTSLAPVEWNAAYRSFNCLTLPTEIPLAMEFAATATIVLSETKLRDHAVDAPGVRWGMLRRLLSPSFRQAAKRLRAWEFPLDRVLEILDTQRDREKNPVGILAEERLHHVAQPTAIATSLFFEHGARLAGSHAAELARIGERFGYLIYLLDAFEDVAKDKRRGDFNPLTAFGLSRDWAKQQCRTVALEIDLALRELGMEPLGLRLRANVAGKLSDTPGLHICTPQARMSWREAIQFSRSMIGTAHRPMAFAGVAAVAFFFPQHAKQADSPEHCLSLGLNLMALGSLFTFANIGTGPQPGPGAGVHAAHAATAAGKTTTGGRGGGCCDSSCCSSCGDCGQAGCCCCECGDCCGSCGECGSCCDC